MLPGHTKLAPDLGFGLLKQWFRKVKVSSLDELAAVVASSAAHNFAQLVETEDGTSIVPMYGWTSFLKRHFRRIDRIKSYKHFTITTHQPGLVHLKLSAESETTSFCILKDNWSPQPDVLPPVIPPPELSKERQWHLFDSIRQFCTESTQDITCPLPTVPRPGAHLEITSPPPSPLPPPSIPPAHPHSLPPPSMPPSAKRSRQLHCSLCGESGHNIRSY